MVTVREIAARLRWHPQKARRFLRRSGLTLGRVGYTVVVDREAWERYLAEHHPDLLRLWEATLDGPYSRVVE